MSDEKPAGLVEKVARAIWESQIANAAHGYEWGWDALLVKAETMAEFADDVENMRSDARAALDVLGFGVYGGVLYWRSAIHVEEK